MTLSRRGKIGENWFKLKQIDRWFASIWWIDTDWPSMCVNSVLWRSKCRRFSQIEARQALRYGNKHSEIKNIKDFGLTWKPVAQLNPTNSCQNARSQRHQISHQICQNCPWCYTFVLYENYIMRLCRALTLWCSLCGYNLGLRVLGRPPWTHIMPAYAHTRSQVGTRLAS